MRLTLEIIMNIHELRQKKGFYIGPGACIIKLFTAAILYVSYIAPIQVFSGKGRAYLA